MTKEQIKEGLDKAYKEAGHNAYFGNGFEAGVKFALGAQKTAHNSDYTEIAKCEECLLAKPTMKNCFCCFKGKLEGSNFA